MEETEYITIIVIFTLIVIVAISGIMIFLFQYRKRKIIHLTEIELIENQHKIDLLNAQVEVQKETMTEIGKELHDNLGQKVTLASIYLQQIPIKSDLGSLKDDSEKVNILLNEILSEMRRLSKSLVSDTLELKNLGEMIQNEAKRITQYTDVNVNADIQCDDSLSSLVNNTIFRIFQEFSQNSLKHGKCKNIGVVLRCENNELHLQCNDDGIGFETTDMVKGIGLTNMNRRAIEIGGTLDIKSQNKKGTQIDFKLNL